MIVTLRQCSLYTFESSFFTVNPCKSSSDFSDGDEVQFSLVNCDSGVRVDCVT